MGAHSNPQNMTPKILADAMKNVNKAHDEDLELWAKDISEIELKAKEPGSPGDTAVEFDIAEIWDSKPIVVVMTGLCGMFFLCMIVWCFIYCKARKKSSA